MTDSKYQILFNNLEDASLAVGVNCVLFTVTENKLKILITSLHPKLEKLLPGGVILNNETAEAAAHRILKEITGVEDVFLQQFKTFSEPKRFNYQLDPETIKILNINFPYHVKFPERVFSIGYFALINFDQILRTGGVMRENNLWIEFKQLPKLAYDNNLIATEALEALRKELFIKPIGYNLLPEKFTMPELQRIYEIILDKPLTRSNFQRKMLSWGIYERLEERKEGVSHKRPFLYRFNKEKYDRAVKNGISFWI